MRWRSRSTVLVLVAVALVLSACGPRYTRVLVEEKGGVTVKLRAQKKGGELVDRGFTHPATISSIRLTNILSTIDVRLGAGEGAERRSAIPTDLLFPIGNAVSKALEKATPAQEVVVQAVRKGRRLKVFTEEHLTSFVAYVEGDDLIIHLVKSDWRIPKQRRAEVPEPYADDEKANFRVLAGRGLVPLGAQTVAADWRSEEFRKSSALKIGPGGRAVRRTVLMESADDAPAAPTEVAPQDLRPEQLRELADLTEARERGEISEAQYHARRRRILRSAPPE